MLPCRCLLLEYVIRLPLTIVFMCVSGALRQDRNELCSTTRCISSASYGLGGRHRLPYVLGEGKAIKSVKHQVQVHFTRLIARERIPMTTVVMVGALVSVMILV